MTTSAATRDEHDKRRAGANGTRREKRFFPVALSPLETCSPAGWLQCLLRPREVHHLT